MEEIIAGLQGFTFTFEQDVELQKGTGLLPFQGMDKSSSAVCNFFAKGLCVKGPTLSLLSRILCPLRHEHGEKMVVCKHWLRGLCRKSDCCNFLHQYDVSRMPVCYFHSKFGNCSNKECPFLHLKSVSKVQDCPWYDQGFCKEVVPCVDTATFIKCCVPTTSPASAPRDLSANLGSPKMSPIFHPGNVKLACHPAMGFDSFSWQHSGARLPGKAHAPLSEEVDPASGLQLKGPACALEPRPPCHRSKLYQLESSKPSLKRVSRKFS
ncbi:Cleavage and polyadenylation-specific factor 4-like [Apodemus speciosus]|uniref:Cleavage and polyadenylation specificity factor subunit 4 n=1 Tax=Apodemus speciosus TaxID=105296 RepID=A0ABQ0FCP2_APOSI